MSAVRVPGQFFFSWFDSPWKTYSSQIFGNIYSSHFLFCDQIIKTLELLPIPNKNMLEESKVLPVIQRWAQTKSAVPQLSEGDGYSSENTSRAHTPLNTPDPSTKPNAEGDADTPKKLPFRRLKIISENSMDSAISDTPSEIELKESREDLEQPDGASAEMAEEQPLQQQEPVRDSALEVSADTSKAQVAEQDAEPEAEVKEGSTAKLDDSVAAETPSQDEEEGVSDVESERSQEQTDKMMDLSDLATKLLDCWKDLKVSWFPCGTALISSGREPPLVHMFLCAKVSCLK